MTKFRDYWYSQVRTTLRYALLASVCGATAVLAGIKPLYVLGFLATGCVLQLIHAASKPRDVLSLREDFFSLGDVSKPFPPLPLDTEAIVHHELESIRALWPRNEPKAPSAVPGFSITSLGGGFQLSERTRKAALDRHEAQLRDWLTRYELAADARYRTFAIPATIVNDPNAAPAESVHMTIRLIGTAKFVPESRAFERPPERSAPDLSRHLSSIAAMDLATASGVTPRIRLAEPRWRIDSNGRVASIDVRRVHAGEEFELPTELFVESASRDPIVVSWELSSAGRSSSWKGEVQVRFDPSPARRPLSRLAGVLAFPDVEIKGEGRGDEVPIRSCDPPARAPQPESDQMIDELRAIAKRNQLEALGLLEQTSQVIGRVGLR